MSDALVSQRNDDADDGDSVRRVRAPMASSLGGEAASVMGWASGHIAKLKAGEIVSFRPRGNSMVPKIRSGQLCTVVPLDGDPSKGDVVLCKVKGHEYLHNVLAVQGGRFQIGNNKGRINGWVSREAIYGKLVEVT